MFGNNPIRKQGFVKDEMNHEGLAVKSIFYTIQGEGPYAGTPAAFVRLIGCNLKCYFCDTDFESDINLLSVSTTAHHIMKLMSKFHVPRVSKQFLVVITGGEPLLQPAIIPLIQILKTATANSVHIQIETNGTVWLDELTEYIDGGDVSIVVSPKTGTVHHMMYNRALAWKYIIAAGAVDSKDGLPVYSTQVKGMGQVLARPHEDARRIYVQPLDDPRDRSGNMNRLHAKETALVAMEQGYQVSFQMHKHLGVE